MAFCTMDKMTMDMDFLAEHISPLAVTAGRAGTPAQTEAERARTTFDHVRCAAKCGVPATAATVTASKTETSILSQFLVTNQGCRI